MLASICSGRVVLVLTFCATEGFTHGRWQSNWFSSGWPKGVCGVMTGGGAKSYCSQ